jgi:hypothetical protein
MYETDYVHDLLTLIISVLVPILPLSIKKEFQKIFPKTIHILQETT